VTARDVDHARKQGASDLEIHETLLIAAMFCMRTSKKWPDHAIPLKHKTRLPTKRRTNLADKQLFLAQILHQLANGCGNVGECARALPLYEEAFRLTPTNFILNLDYAGAALDAEESVQSESCSNLSLPDRTCSQSV
jgi:hypothetical protein